MATFVTRLRIILWKSYLIRRRHWFMTLLETVIPILLFLMVAFLRTQISGYNHEKIEKTINYAKSTSSMVYSEAYMLSTIYYAPKTNISDQLINLTCSKLHNNPAPKGYANELDFLQDYVNISSDEMETIFVLFENRTSDTHLQYTLRYNDKRSLWSMDVLFGSNVKYKNSGFTAVQMALDSSFIEMALGTARDTATTFDMFIQEMPVPPHIQQTGVEEIFQVILPFVTLCSFIFMCPMVIKRVVEDKYSGIKELLRMSGMKSWMLWCGWCLHSLLVNVVAICIIVVLMKVRLWDVPYAPIEHCSATVFFVFLVLYCLAAIALCFFISAIFSRPSLAMIIGIVIWLFTFYIPNALVKERTGWYWRFITALFCPNMAMKFGYDAINAFEQQETGLTWTALNRQSSPNNLSMLTVFLAFLFNTFFYLLVALYAENVLPGRFGIARSFYYPFTGIYTKIVRKLRKNDVANNSNQQHSNGHSNVANIEESAAGQRTAIELCNVRKTYGGGATVAVDNLSMHFYERQITVLLGHNGAGKTTTMSMLTGMVPASSGAIYIEGANVRIQLDQCRRSMGLCPQHNALFTDLTVMEHLQFFAMLRGRTFTEARQEANNLLKLLHFTEKRNSLPANLSGGMQRKLCLGNAIIGGAQVLVLDEPTSGMDPETRRDIWNLLLQWRKSKTILLTTHFMEEADVLGDWIAIMANGRLQCYGTPMFLKRKYATGYHLSLTLDGALDQDERSTTMMNIDKTIREYVPTAKRLREHGRNVVYQLPMEQKTSFSKLFNNFEQASKRLHVNNMSMTVTTLEEVFLRAKSEVSNDTVDYDLNVKSDSTLPTNVASRGLRNTIMGLLYKRMYFLRRKGYLYFAPIVISILLTILTVYLGDTSRGLSFEERPLALNLDIYGDSIVFYSINENVRNRQKYNESLRSLVEQSISTLPMEVADVPAAIITRGTEDFVYYQHKLIVAAELRENSQAKLEFNALYSTYAAHSTPLSVNLMMNTLARTLLNASYTIITTNQPLMNVALNTPQQQSQYIIALLWMLFVPFGCLFLMGNFLLFPHMEISTSFLHLQRMAGVSSYTYWLVNYIFDYATFAVIILVKLLFASVFSAIIFWYTPFTFGVYFGPLLAVFLTYGAANLPFVYLFSYHRKSMAGAFCIWFLVGLLMAIIVAPVVVALCSIDNADQLLRIGRILKHLCLILMPHFALAYLLWNVANVAVFNYNWEHTSEGLHSFEFRDSPCRQNSSTYASEACKIQHSFWWNADFGIGYDLVEMLASSVLYLYIVVLLSTNYVPRLVEVFWAIIRRFVPLVWKRKQQQLQKSQNHQQLDSISDGETSGTAAAPPLDATLQVYNLRKLYALRLAVDDVSFHVRPGECYGLLGVNGAGKTTTFRMLTKDLAPTSGMIYMHTGNQVISMAHSKYLEQLGYCPQYDALNLALSGRELLTTFALLRGYNAADVDRVATVFIEIFGLNGYEGRPCAKYSGGNKRKLCLALAFIGCAPIILMDEPTSGVDPASRRAFWTILAQMQRLRNVSFILSSHSMEECQVLCNRIGILKEGRVYVEGTLAELKQQFEEGYTVMFKLRQVETTTQTEDSPDGNLIGSYSSMSGTQPSVSNVAVNQLKADVNRAFQRVDLRDEHSGLLHYHVVDAHYTWSTLFKCIEKLTVKHSACVEDYTIGEVSLEDIFLSVARGR